MKLFRIEKKSNGRVYVYCGRVKLFSVKLKLSKLKKFYNNCVNIIQTPYINYRLRHCKYVHLMHTEKFTEATIRFFNENFNAKDHLFLCALAGNYSSIPKAENSICLRGMKGLNFDRENIKKIICHGLFIPEILDWLYTHPNISREKCYWGIWGGDLYDIPHDEKGIPTDPRDLVIRQNFKGYLTLSDEAYAREKLSLDPSKTFYMAPALFPITKEMIDKTNKEKHDYVQIQVNHSTNKTTLEMLDILSRWKDKNIRVSTVLSYGHMEYADDIKQKGKEIFGNKFSYLDHMLSAQEYAQFLAQNDILILNQKRQQGFGNTVASLNLGTKIFIKSDVTTYDFFNDKEKIKIFDTYEIKKMTFDDFVTYPEKEENLQKARRYYDNDYLVALWKNILSS